MSSTNNTNSGPYATKSDLSGKANSSDLNNYLPLSGGQMTGATVGRNINDGIFQINGGTNWSKGASVSLFGMNSLEQGTPRHGHFLIDANDGTTWTRLQGTPNGSLTWGGKNLDVIEEQGDGYIRYTNGIQICWGIKNFSNLTFLDQWGDSVLLSPELTISYSKTFTSVPACSLFMMSGWSSWVVSDGTTSTSSVVYFKVARPKGSIDSSVTNAFVNMSYIAIGRWK